MDSSGRSIALQYLRSRGMSEREADEALVAVALDGRLMRLIYMAGTVRMIEEVNLDEEDTWPGPSRP